MTAAERIPLLEMRARIVATVRAFFDNRGFVEVETAVRIAAPALGHSRTDLNYRAKRAGFHSYKKVQKGEYEKLY